MPRIAEAQGAADKAIRLFTYLKELSELRSKTIRSVSNYEQVVWLADLPEEPGCRCAAWFLEGEEEDDVWVEVKRPNPSPPPPSPSTELALWLDERDVPRSDLDAPPLRDKIPQPTPDPVGRNALQEDQEVDDDFEDAEPDEDRPEEKFEYLTDHPEITQAWERYVERLWRPWAERDRRIRAVQRIYTDLFSIYQQQQRLGEQFEVVLGLGLLTWRTPAGPIVNRHLITAQLDLTFDAVRGIMAVGPAAEGPKLTPEHDMLEAADRPEIREQEDFATRLEALGDEPWQEEPLHDLFSAWVHSVSSRGRFERGLVPDYEATVDPIVRLAPAIILRKRTERSLIRVYDEIIAQIEQTGEVPLGVRRLVEIVDDSTAPDMAPYTESNGHRDQDPEVYFPLPANDEQLEIVQRLTTRQGVLVQGPPGTGKSHTIANLICHLLATGNRVLVTSHTPRALQVLRDKIPPEVADLCVTLLGSDREALQDLEESVHGITSQYDQWNAARNQREIDGLVAKLDQLRRRESELQADMTSIRERETRQHDLGFRGYAGTAAVIARRVAAEEERYGWLSEDPVGDEPPIADSEIARLLDLLRRLSEERCREVEQTFVPLDQLTIPMEFARLCQNEAAARERSARLASAREFPAYRRLSKADPAQLAVFAEGLRALQTAYLTAHRQLQSWARQAMAEILAGQDRSWQRLREMTRTQIDRLAGLLGDGDRQLVGLDPHNLTKARADAAALLAHLQAGGGMGFGPFRAKQVKDAGYLIDGVTVDGRRCDIPEILKQLIDRIDITTGLDELNRAWQPYQQVAPSVPSLQVASFQDLLESLDQALALGQRVAALKDLLSGFSGVAEPMWQEMDEIGLLLAAVEAVEADHQAQRAATALDTLKEPLQRAVIASDAHPVVKLLLDGVSQRNVARYTDAWDLVRRLEEDRSAARDRQALWDRLGATAPALAGALKQTADDPIWDQRLASFSIAWDWARANHWLTRLGDPAEFRRLTRDLEHCRGDIHQAICGLAATRAWRHFFDRMTEPQRQHLIAWTQAMRRGGKWTGKYASTHRQAAREHMDACRTAIPAWIMPIYRVAETVNPGGDQFDVIIVDEASQSGPEALFLQYLGKKILVVGDDKQISPEFVGMDRENVNLLRTRHLHGLPHNDALGVDTSFFDQAQIRYGGRIRLREHFRCMPEIIQFSNNLCYADEPLIPLRQYGVDRLPPVVVSPVSDGYRIGSGSRVENLPEAQAVVEQILRCCDDPAYDDKSMGVISLQGENQAKKIQALLLDRLGPEEMERRRLICGDAYAFQGDERDVMFLSLVAAPGGDSRIGTLSSARDERRFNVAASRARDQMWLFHSATLQDLSERDLRYKLLDYCLNPRVESLDFEGVDVEGDEVVPPFESIFEQKVYSRIRARGYRVTPQVEVAGYRLDLVVEGMRGRLAVECDGDAWHGPDRYAEDMARQRQLERCGWTIWRVGGSTFFRDPDEAMEDLWHLLDKLDIRPAADPTENGRHLEAPAPQARAHRSVEEALAPGLPPPSSEQWQHDETQPVSVVVDVDKTESVVMMNPFVGWKAHPLPDPRSSSLDEVMHGLVQIVRAEGPMFCQRAYRLYASVTVGEEFGRQLRSIFNKAMFRAVQEGRLMATDELKAPGMINQVVRPHGCPIVVLRERGGRLLGEIPPFELAALMRVVCDEEDERREDDVELFFFRVLALLGLERNIDSDWQTNILLRAYSMLSRVPGDVQQIGLFEVQN